jgi:hypothetical protein
MWKEVKYFYYYKSPVSKKTVVELNAVSATAKDRLSKYAIWTENV